MKSGLSHITLIVRDLNRTAKLLEAVLHAQEVYSSGSDTFSISKEKFFLVGDLWLCIMEGEPLSDRSYNHIAFRIDEDDLEDCIKRIESAGAEIRLGRPRVEGEGRSVYFFDYDNHLFELHTGSLSERLSAYSNNSQPE